MQLCFFEDEHCANFKPLTLTRPADDLRTGILTIREKWQLALDHPKWTRCIRTELKNVFKSNAVDENKECLWLNSRYLPSEKLLKEIKRLKPGDTIKDTDAVVAAKVNGDIASRWLKAGKPDFSTCQTVQNDSFRGVNHLWDLFLINSKQIEKDIARLNINPSSTRISDKAVLEQQDNIFIEKGVDIKAGAILNAEKGPIYLGKNAAVSNGAIIQGPAAIGRKSVVKPAANIHSNTTIGPVCKAGGEVSDSIFHSYSNKGHDGYLGHSLIGQWCNLGAGTNNSNLKNNYSDIRITDWNTNQPVETGQQFLGTIMADHTKTAIGTRLNTGTVCGVNCNIFSVDFPPKLIPSFSWVSSGGIQTYKLDKAFETMQAMMARRDVSLTKAYKQLIRFIFDNRINQ